jgi:hypothetical protein
MHFLRTFEALLTGTARRVDSWEVAVLDVAMLALTAAFFALSVALVAGCDRLSGDRDGS